MTVFEKISNERSPQYESRCIFFRAAEDRKDKNSLWKAQNESFSSLHSKFPENQRFFTLWVLSSVYTSRGVPRTNCSIKSRLLLCSNAFQGQNFGQFWLIFSCFTCENWLVRHNNSCSFGSQINYCKQYVWIYILKWSFDRVFSKSPKRFWSKNPKETPF